MLRMLKKPTKIIFYENKLIISTKRFLNNTCFSNFNYFCQQLQLRSSCNCNSAIATSEAVEEKQK